MDLKETLIGKLRDQFYGKIYSRGRQYYSGGAVGEIKAETGGDAERIIARGKVRGRRIYNARLFFDPHTLEFEGFECNCPYADEDECKHAAAFGLKFVDLLCDFSEKHSGNFNKEEFENYLNGKAKNALDEKYSPGFSGPAAGRDISSGSNNNPLDELKRLFSSNKDRLPEDLLREAKKILGGDFGKKSADLKTDRVMIFPAPKPKPKHDAIRINDFYLSVYFGYQKINASVFKSNNEYKKIEPEYFLEKREFLTSEQIELFEYLASLSKEDGDYNPIRLLKFIEKSGMRFYKGNHYGFGEKDKFSIIDGQKIDLNAKLLDKPWVSEYDDSLKKIRFIFEMETKYAKAEGVFFGDEGVVLETLMRAVICYLPEHALKILREARDKYEYSSYDRRKEKTVELELAEEEIIKINEILPELKESFSLETDLPDNLEIKEHKNPVSKIVVDYDSVAQELEIRPSVDYGLEKQNVGESVYAAKLRNKDNKPEFRRREVFPWKDYIIKRAGNLIEWAKIEKEKEIKIFRVFYKNLDATGFSKTLKLRKSGDQAIFDFYENHWPKIISLCQRSNIVVEFEKDKLEIESVEFNADFDVDMDAANDWLAFDVECYCGKGKITIDILREYIESERKFIRQNGKLIRVSNREELEKLVKMLESFHQKAGQKFEGRVYHAPELEDVIGSEYYNSKISKNFQKFMREAQSGKPVEKVKIPARIKKTLRDYQKEGVDWFYFLRKYHFGGILADDMGLGKTLQALSLVSMNPVENKPSLVVCPKTLLFNWEDEAAKFFPKMKTLVIQGNPEERRAQLKKLKKYDLVVTSYPAVKKDKDKYAKLKFNYCFLDEAQFIKNAKTQNARAVKEINADYRLALTGTPLENSVSEVWSIFDFLMPGFLKKKKDFFERFEKPIMKESDAAAMQTLKKKTACFMLRRTKEKVLKELPAKIEQASHCRLGGAQNVLYQEILANVKSEIIETVKMRGFAKSQIHILAGLTKLRQTCNHPALLLKDKKHEKYESAKLEMFLEVVGEIVSSDRKVLVFSQFTAMLDILSKELDKNKVDHHYLSGKTKNRKELVNDFNENKNIRVFLISLKAGGTGLNLTAADNVIIFDPWWNPSVENQAIDRAHRIGQKRTVNVYRFITKGTIEEKIVALQNKKKFLFDNLIGESSDMFKKLTWDDVRDLFSV